MRSVRLVSNLWLAMSSATRGTTRGTTSPAIRSTNPPQRLPSVFSAAASATELGAARGSGAVGGDSSGPDDGDRAMRELAGYHPIVIEGMGYYDPRDPAVVAGNICENLGAHFASRGGQSDGPYLVVVQGDPLTERGISAITPRVAECLGLKRGLVCLDEDIDPTHSQNADRENVVLEVSYSRLAGILSRLPYEGGGEGSSEKSVLRAMEESIDALVRQKNLEREAIGKPPMKEYFKQYALLQEVTKASLHRLCGGRLTIAHTSADINPYSVTSFYRVGLDLGLYHEDANMVAYRNLSEDHKSQEVLDFDAIDTR
ncbi:unnamed protein product [Pseudo-nitzschia multistriata]|uniref:Uncharacterized protein n=1 Tax=Pseudo-nitzschia multistriata TaxID=183589 RepID=A0A448Z9Z4_9STRA|nr:unnamed protein product [Pseudo-nitzschia multistriata]